MLLNDLNIVLMVAEFRNITAAATHLNMRTATASAAVKRVEQQLGTELFVRTTRSLRLSAAGERFMPTCHEALKMLNDAQQNVKADNGIVEGEICLGISSDLGRNLVVPWLDTFMDSHENISVKLHLSDSKVDFYRDPIDLVLRYGKPSDANTYGFKICNVPSLLVASPAYIEKHGAPSSIQTLQQQNGLFYQLYDKTYDEWEFLRDGTQTKVKMSGNRIANDGEIVRKWAVAGKGVAIKSSLDAYDDIVNKRLIRMLPEYSPRPTQLWLICPSRQTITPAVRLLRDMLKAQTQKILIHLCELDVITKESLEDNLE